MSLLPFSTSDRNELEMPVADATSLSERRLASLIARRVGPSADRTSGSSITVDEVSAGGS